MTEFALASAAGSSPAMLARSCAEQLRGATGHTLGFLYATSALSKSYASILDVLRQQTGVLNWAGTVGLGVCATGREFFDEPAVVAMTCQLDGAGYRFIQGKSAADLKEGSIASAETIGIVHGDPRNAAVTDVIAGIARRYGTYLVGGLTSGEGDFPQAAGTRVADGGVSGVLLSGRSVAVSVGLSQGCSPIGPMREITECQGQIITTLDGRRALDVLREDAGGSESDDPRRWLANLHAALPVPGSDRGAYLVRNLVGIDARGGLIAIADKIDAGDRLMFVRRDRTSAERDLQRMLGDVKSRAAGPPKAGLYFSCLARGPNLFNDGHELKAIRETFGDIPVVGFFGNGEIAHDRVYGYTGVLTVFS
ncbi:MAG TPA: FIST N-terminal domain-containing protein [Hyphomicrobiaceae bacterium]|nr:FIST N-terminal domain-containing protein [Hyphomicrobiaceae bacterium]